MWHKYFNKILASDLSKKTENSMLGIDFKKWFDKIINQADT